jgi:cell division septal protein FtsQ
MSARPISLLSRLRAPSLPSRPVLVRRLLLLTIVAAALAVLYLLWFRDSSFVRVSDVTVRGADTDAAAASALTDAAQGQSTLDFDPDVLRAAVADDPQIASLSARTDFPPGVTIDVVARTPAGYINDGDGAVVAGDGTVLSTGGNPPDGIPTIDAEATSLGARAEGPALNVAKVLGAAPAELLPEVESSTVDKDAGPVVVLTGGLELRFGDPSRAAQKWKAATAVLASPDFEGAEYLDLSVPGRPVAG